MPVTKPVIAPRRSVALFALLAMVMVVVSYIVILCIAAACVYFPYLLLISVSTTAQVLFLFLSGIAVAGAMVWSLLPRWDKFEAPGLLLDRSSQPRLFAELDAIAAALGEPLPREVYLIGQVNAFVADRGGIMGFGSRRVMGIGLPLLSSLTLPEVRAVLAHEFAHYYSGDTRMGPWVYKTQTAMIRTFQNIGSLGRIGRIAALQLMNAVASIVLKWYFILFLRVINFVSRRKEYRADELACLVAGAQPMIQGLRKIHGAGMAWTPYWNTEVVPVLNQGCLPGIADGFSRFLSAPQIAVQVENGIAHEIAEGKTQPYDTHPPLKDRIAAIEKLSGKWAEEGLDSARGTALSLLDDPDRAEQRYIELMNPKVAKDSLRRVGWDEIGRTLTIPSWTAAVAENAKELEGATIGTIPESIPQLPQIGSRIRDPRGMLLSPQQRTERAGLLLAMAMGLALLKNGWELEAQPGSFYLHRAGQRLNVVTLIRELVSGKRTRESWARLCRELGIAELKLSPPADGEETAI
jgi:Zn-dependent protease with chaperone function